MNRVQKKSFSLATKLTKPTKRSQLIIDRVQNRKATQKLIPTCITLLYHIPSTEKQE